MRNDPDKLDASQLQHEAEHVKPAQKRSVMSYLTILFAVAFLLMLMSYFMQRRNSDMALDQQETLAVTAMKSIEELRDDNEALLKQVDRLQSELETRADNAMQLQQTAEARQAELHQLQVQYEALNYLNQIRTLYNQRRTQDANAVLAQAEKAMEAAGGMDAVLGQVSAGLTDEAREDYDPQDAYRMLLDWLSP